MRSLYLLSGALSAADLSALGGLGAHTPLAVIPLVVASLGAHDGADDVLEAALPAHLAVRDRPSTPDGFGSPPDRLLVAPDRS